MTDGKRSAVGLFLAAILGAATGAAVLALLVRPGRVIEAEQINLVDADRKQRAILSADRNGSALTLFDGEGKKQTTLYVRNDGSGLALSDAKGVARAALRLFDEPGKPPAGQLLTIPVNGIAKPGLDSLTSDGPVLELSDEAGRRRLGMKVFHGVPTLGLMDETGKLGVLLNLDGDGPAVVLLKDEWQIGQNVQNIGPELQLSTAGGQPRAVLKVVAGEPTLTLHDRTGKVVRTLSVP